MTLLFSNCVEWSPWSGGGSDVWTGWDVKVSLALDAGISSNYDEIKNNSPTRKMDFIS